jgi:hypothetical protein
MQPRILHTALLGTLTSILSATAQDALGFTAVLRDANALAGAHDIEVRDGLAFVAGKGFTRRNLPPGGVYPYEAGKGGSFAIVDVKQPATPKVLWFADTPVAFEDAETVLPLGRNRLLVGTRDLFLFDTSDRAKPRQIAAIKDRPRVDIINGFTRLGSTVFAANKLGHIFAVDVSAPDSIRMLGSHETRESGELSSPHDAALSGGEDDGHDLVLANGHLFVTAQTSHSLVVIRLSDALQRLASP